MDTLTNVDVYLPQVSDLLAAISSENPAGVDLSYSLLYERIHEARRQDDPSLTQGDWATPLKLAEWRLAQTLCEDGLRSQSKDLQLAAWYIESCTRNEGAQGLSRGLQLLHGLLALYWETGYPKFESGDLSERAARIEWIDQNLSMAVSQIPMTSLPQPEYTWLDWELSRRLANLELKDARTENNEMSEGAVSAEAFDKAATQSGRSFYLSLQKDFQQALATLSQLTALVDERFGIDAPSMKLLQRALSNCSNLVERLLTESVGTAIPMPLPVVSQPNSSTIPTTPNQASTSRHEAIRLLRDAAQYFRQQEPHSPVAYLAERAARWAEMPMDVWLREVIKDQGTLLQLQELLDLPSPDIAI